MKQAIVFERKEGKARKDDGLQKTIVLQWNVVDPPGVSLGLRVDPEGVDIVGGLPSFDTQAEEKAWRFQVDMATVAQRFIRQEALVPSDEHLAALVRSSKDPE